jgi:hypothetical protein
MSKLFNFHIPTFFYAPDGAAADGGGVPADQSESTASKTDGQPDANATDQPSNPDADGKAEGDGAETNTDEFDEKELALLPNRLKELERKQAKLAKLNETKSAIADTDKQLAASKTSNPDDDDDEDEIVFHGATVPKALASYIKSLEEKIENAHSRFSDLDSAKANAELQAAGEEVVKEFHNGMFEIADKVFKSVPSSQKDNLREYLMLKSDKLADEYAENGIPFSPEIANEIARKAIINARSLFGSLGEAAIKDAAATKNKHKVGPEVGTAGTEGPIDERDLPLDKREKIQEDRVKAAQALAAARR